MEYTFNLGVRDLVTPKLLKIQRAIKNIQPFKHYDKEAKTAAHRTDKLAMSFKKVKSSVKQLNVEYGINKRKINELERATKNAGSKEKRILHEEISLLKKKNREIERGTTLNRRQGSAAKVKTGASPLIGKAGLIIGAIGGAGALIGGTAKAANTQQQAEAQVATGIKSTGNAAGFSLSQFKRMASGLQSKSLYGDENILKNVTAQLQTFTNIGGKMFKDAQKNVLDIATKTGHGLNETSVMLGKALNDPIKGVSSLTRVGIQFSDSQKKQIKLYQESGQLAKAQGIINKEIVKEFGGSAEAAAKAGLGPFKQMKMTIGDLGETIGGLLLPVINKLATGIKKLVEGFKNFLDSDNFKKILTNIHNIFSSANNAFSNIKGYLLEMWSGIKGAVVNIWGSLKQFFTTFTKIFHSIFKNFNKANGAFSKISSFLNVLFKTIGKIVSFILKLAQVLGIVLMPVFKGIVNLVTWFYDKLMKPIISWIGRVFTWLNSMLDKILLKWNKKKNKENGITAPPDNTIDTQANDKNNTYSNNFNLGNTDNTSAGLPDNSVTLQTNRQIKNYTFNINSLVKDLTIETTELKESETEVQDIVTRMLRKAVLDVQNY